MVLLCCLVVALRYLIVTCSFCWPSNIGFNGKMWLMLVKLWIRLMILSPEWIACYLRLMISSKLWWKYLFKRWFYTKMLCILIVFNVFLCLFLVDLYVFREALKGFLYVVRLVVSPRLLTIVSFVWHWVDSLV